MHKLNLHSDNIGKSNYRVNYVIKNKKAIHGYEHGKLAPAFRNMYPIFNKEKKYIGSVEISFSAAKIKEYLSKVSKIHTHFLIDKNIFNKITKNSELKLKYILSQEHDDYLMDIVFNNNEKKYNVINKKIKEQIKQEIKKGKKFSVYSSYDNKSVVISFYPIKNIEHKKSVAWIVSYENDTFIDMTLKSNFIILISIFIIYI